MKQLSFISTYFLIIALALSCAAPHEAGIWVDRTKLTGKSYQSILVLVQSKDLVARQTVEKALESAAKKKGHIVLKSFDLLPPSLSSPALPTKEEVQAAVKKSGADGVFVVSLLRKEEEVRYNPGTTSYSPMPYYGWSGNLWGYYNYYSPTVSTPGYYSHEKQYFIQSNLYDVQSEALMVSVQSVVYDPGSLDKFCKSYVKDLVNKLESEGLFKKK
jgi:hypothetical protein